MTTAFFFNLAFAAAVALSPTPVVVVILMLFSARGRINALAFLLGWVVGLAILAVVLWSLVQAGLGYLDSNAAAARPVLHIALGALLIWLGIRQWNRLPKTTPEEARPEWMTKLDEMLTKSTDIFTPARAFFLAIVMSALSPKNIALMLAAILVMYDAHLELSQSVFLLLIFVVISSITVGIPTLYALLKGKDAQASLFAWKDWLVANRGHAVALMLFTFGGILVMNGFLAWLEQMA